MKISSHILPGSGHGAARALRLLPIIVLLLKLPASAQLLILPESDARTRILPLRGPVKTLMQSDSSATPTTGAPSWRTSLMAELDRTGRLVSWSGEGCERFPCHRPSITLDEHGRVVTESGWSDPLRAPRETGRWVGNIRFERRYSYDQNGTLVRVVEHREWISRDSAGPETLEDAEELYTYDAGGRLTDVRLAWGSETTTIALRYNSTGGCRVLTSSIPAVGVPHGTERRLDREGMLLSQVDIYDSEERTTTTYVNDSLGNPIKVLRSDLGRSMATIVHEYRYDLHGNWIERRTYQSSDPPRPAGERRPTRKDRTRRPIAISRRTITYYQDNREGALIPPPLVY